MTTTQRYRALRLDATGAALQPVDLEVPTPGPGEAVIEVTAAGVCRSDVHYRSGTPKSPPLPRVLGHEIAGRIRLLGADAPDHLAIGDRVGVHYLVSCGACASCLKGREQFCDAGQMFGNDRDGGYAEMVVVPVRNLAPIPDSVDDRHAAVMMCSTVTVHHALRRARFEHGETLAVVGIGGLGASAVKLAVVFGASEVYAVDPDSSKRHLAASWGAVPVDPADPTSVARLAGTVDVALDLVGASSTFELGVNLLGFGGRLAVVGLGASPATIHPYRDIVGRELSVFGVMDHLRSDVDAVLSMAADGRLDLSDVVTGTVPLDADQVTAALDDLADHRGGVRTVIVPAPSGG